MTTGELALGVLNDAVRHGAAFRCRPAAPAGARSRQGGLSAPVGHGRIRCGAAWSPRSQITLEFCATRQREASSQPHVAGASGGAQRRENLATAGVGRFLGACLEAPEIPLLSMAFVGGPQAAGHLLGVAVRHPRALHLEDRRRVIRVLGREGELKRSCLGVCERIERLSDRPAPACACDPRVRQCGYGAGIDRRGQVPGGTVCGAVSSTGDP
jgi:hypothetical protein